MSAGHVVVLVLLWAGVACVLLSAVALVRLDGAFMRLHALAPASCLGLPLIALAVAVDQGAGRAAVKTLLIGLLFAVGGTASAIAVGKAADKSGEGADR
ncbi:cation:proton antiporter [Streptomyces sp. NBC_01477]|uniref:cation:proton antiporter n=1 Tax=Streptomyces sp. NBC_01477 TaxID=2976015 RepID=UPI002E322299|nr:monovalent cation/H(+) antiporter subunit G [Streptomyces sp. NBC_01477]